MNVKINSNVRKKVHTAPSKPTENYFAVDLFSAEMCSENIINISLPLHVEHLTVAYSVLFLQPAVREQHKHSLSLIRPLLALFLVFSNS